MEWVANANNEEIMSLKNDAEFRQRLESADNRYAVIGQLARDARAMSAQYNYKLLFSTAITHVVHGTDPTDDQYSADLYEDYQIRELFCTVDDIDVRNAVYDSYFESKKQHHLIYIYNNVCDSGRQARIRILTRQLWYTCIDE